MAEPKQIRRGLEMKKKNNVNDNTENMLSGCVFWVIANCFEHAAACTRLFDAHDK